MSKKCCNLKDEYYIFEWNYFIFLLLIRMKKTIIGILTVMVLGMGLWFAQDSNIADYTNQLFEWTTLFGYGDENKVEVKNIEEDAITFVSPVLKNEEEEIITNYDVLFGAHPLEDILEDSSLTDSLKTKKVSAEKNTERFSFSLNVEEDSLDTEAIYYVYVLPKDVADMPWTVSREFCFNLKYKISDLGKECVAKVKEAKEQEAAIHNAPGADIELANVTHTVDGETITLTWTAIDGSNTLEFFLLNEDETDSDDTQRERLGKANMMDQKFVFSYDGEHSTSVLIKPDNGGREKVYTLNFTPPVEKEEPTKKPEPKKKPKPEIPVVPKTWTKENMLIILIIAILGFVLYKAMRRTR